MLRAAAREPVGLTHGPRHRVPRADVAEPGKEIFASVGTLATGGNGGGQTLVQLTEDGEVVDEGGNAGDDRLRGGRDSDGCRGGRGRDSLRSCER